MALTCYKVHWSGPKTKLYNGTNAHGPWGSCMYEKLGQVEPIL